MTLRDALNALGVPFWEAGEHHHVREGNVGIDCPTCSPNSRSAKLSIHLDRLWATCWTCGRFRLGEVLSEITGRPIREVLALLPGRLYAGYVRDSYQPRPTGKYAPPPGVEPMLPAHRKYLARRGIDPDYAAEQWGIQGIGGDGGEFQWRLFLPALSGGKPVSWTTRAVGTASLRYKAAAPPQEAFPLKSLLYGEHLCKHAVCVVEGPLGAVYGGPGFVATCGTAVTPAQIRRIASFPVRVIAFDNEEPAQRAASKLASQLAPYPGETYVVRFSGPSPDESPDDELKEIRSRFLA